MGKKLLHIVYMLTQKMGRLSFGKVSLGVLAPPSLPIGRQVGGCLPAGRQGGLLLLLLCSLSSFAQVTIPNPNWPLDSVVNRSVHFYTVPGDVNYDTPSTFVWNVYGGKLYYDQTALSLAGDGTTATVQGDVSNVTRLYVAWDISTQLDTGYVYVYEISADSCQRSDLDEEKFRGMRIKISAPPIARFITDETIVCSNNDSARVILEIEGMPPYDLVYTLNDVRYEMHITEADLADWDDDGEADNISFFHSNFSTITTDEVYVYEIIEVSSGGVPGKILPEFPSHTLIAHVQPPAPEILHEWTEVTTGTPNVYTYHLADVGISPAEWSWTLRDVNTNFVNDYSSATNPNWDVTFSQPAGWYYFEVRYTDTYGCLSPYDSLNIELFDLPTIAFVGNDTIINCSESSLVPGEKFEFVVEYYGARMYGFTYEVYDYNGTVVDGGVFDDQTNRTNIISIDNNFINDALPEEIRPWKVVITSATSEDSRVGVTILDSDVPGGRDERVIMIYPKPMIHDDIDFAN
jgi:hypothetical protein